MTELLHTIARVRESVRAARASGSRIVLVPTMGALHEGHLALVRRARELGDHVVVSIFVNPLQFGPGEDFERYPRTLESDLAALGGLADAVFAPSAGEMYPHGPSATRVAAGPVAARFEGASRPGHFDGMLTVVVKLLNIVAPDAVVFGQKDAQQVFLVRQAVDDLDLPVEVAVVPIVRESDGLARSSRNRYLSDEERRLALALSTAIAAAQHEAAAGGGAEEVQAAARRAFDAVPAVKLDYLVVVDPASFDEVDDRYRGAGLLLVAARVGATRLIDNGSLTLGDGAGSTDSATESFRE